MHKKKLFKLKEFMHFICGDEDPLAHYREMAFRPLAVSCLTALSLLEYSFCAIWGVSIR
jgi:hypothetical protein